MKKLIFVIFMQMKQFDIIVGDVSFISLREILPHVAENLMNTNTILVAMVKLNLRRGGIRLIRELLKTIKFVDRFYPILKIGRKSILLS